MKHILIILLSFLILFSCKKEEKAPEPTSIAGVKLEKAKQEKVKDSISKIIIALDKKLAELDTIKKLTKVSTYQIKPSHFEHYINLQGNTKTDKNIILRPLASGTITRVYVKEGQRVYAGQKLFQLDNAVLINSINEVKNQLSLAQTAYDRQKRLWEQKIGSEMQYLQAKTQKESLEKKIYTLNSQAKNYRVTAPFSGVIDGLIATKGDLASPQTPLARLINLQKMYIESDVAENYLKSIKKGNKVIVNLNAIGKEFNTKIAQIGNSISPDNRTFKIRINLSNKKGAIKPNLLADLKIKDFDVKEAIVIPTKLIQIDQNENNFVYSVIDKDGGKSVHKNLITVLNSYKNKSLITKGLTKDAVLIDEGSRTVSNGQEIEVGK